jgi:hypothetical protein
VTKDKDWEVDFSLRRRNECHRDFTANGLDVNIKVGKTELE